MEKQIILAMTLLALVTLSDCDATLTITFSPAKPSKQEDISDTETIATASATSATNFSITDNPTMFNISKSGVITLTKGSTLDFETKQSHNITVWAIAGSNSGTETVTLTVTDVNEKPVYLNATQTIKVCSNLNPGSIIGTYKANDPDKSGQNGVVKYTYAGDDSVAKFAYNLTTGVLTKTAAAFNVTVKNLYRLSLTATDGGTPHLSGTATLTVNVTTAACTTSKSKSSASALATSGSLVAVGVAFMIILTDWV